MMEQLPLCPSISLVALTDSLCLMEYGFFKKLKKKKICKPDLSKKKEDFMFYFRLIPLVNTCSASPVTHSIAQAI